MKLSVKYNRVSTMQQSGERFREDASTYNLTLFDKVSGTVPFSKRPEGAKLVKLIEEGKVERVVVEEISRLGRNVMDVAKTLRFLEDYKVNLCIRGMGIESMIDGKPNSTFRLILQIMASIAEMEREHIKERTSQGRAIAVSKGVKMGRKEGSNESREKFLKKHEDIQRMLKSDYTIREIAVITKKAPSTVQRVKATLREMNKLLTM
jgi:DNA invertase Pin-like site-specific DNA recombinase